MCWKLYVHFSEGVPQWLLYMDKRGLEVSWHRAPGLPPALRVWLTLMSGIHLGTVKFNVPGFFYMNHALEKLSGSKLKAKNAAQQSNGLPKSIPSVVSCTCPIPGPPSKAKGDSLYTEKNATSKRYFSIFSHTLFLNILFKL